MLYVSDLKANLDTFNLPVEFVEALPERCPECGAPMAVDEGLLTVSCTNDSCISYVKERLSIFFSLIGLQVSFKEISAILKRNNWQTPLEIFKHPEDAYLYEGIEPRRQREIMQRVSDYRKDALQTYWKLMSLTGRIDQGHAYLFFRDCLTLSELDNKIDEIYTNPQNIGDAKAILNALQAKKDMEVLRYVPQDA